MPIEAAVMTAGVVSPKYGRTPVWIPGKLAEGPEEAADAGV